MTNYGFYLSNKIDDIANFFTGSPNNCKITIDYEDLIEYNSELESHYINTNSISLPLVSIDDVLSYFSKGKENYDEYEK